MFVVWLVLALIVFICFGLFFFVRLCIACVLVSPNCVLKCAYERLFGHLMSYIWDVWVGCSRWATIVWAKTGTDTYTFVFFARCGRASFFAHSHQSIHFFFVKGTSNQEQIPLESSPIGGHSMKARRRNDNKWPLRSKGRAMDEGCKRGAHDSRKVLVALSHPLKSDAPWGYKRECGIAYFSKDSLLTNYCDYLDIPPPMGGLLWSKQRNMRGENTRSRWAREGREESNGDYMLSTPIPLRKRTKLPPKANMFTLPSTEIQGWERIRREWTDPKWKMRASKSTEHFLRFHRYRGCTCNLNPNFCVYLCPPSLFQSYLSQYWYRGQGTNGPWGVHACILEQKTKSWSCFCHAWTITIVQSGKPGQTKALGVGSEGVWTVRTDGYLEWPSIFYLLIVYCPFSNP